MTVREVEESEGLLVYHGLTAQNEQRTRRKPSSNFIQFRLASDRLFAGQIDPLPWFSLRYHTRTPQPTAPVLALGPGGARAQPIAHQLHIAREVADRMAPRVLLADEVGLGKTIEAGLIIHRQLLSGRAGRVLILVPKTSSTSGWWRCAGASTCRWPCSTRSASPKAMPAIPSRTPSWPWSPWSG